MANRLDALESSNAEFKPENTYDTVHNNNREVEKSKKRTKPRYSSVRIKSKPRMEIEAFKFATGLKFDNDAVVRLLDFWKANAKMADKKKFDRYLNMLEEDGTN